MLIQQGDVLIRSISEIPSDLKKFRQDHRGYVLAEGEHTGHFHGVVCVDDDVDMWKDDSTGKLYMSNRSDITVTHQEHSHISVPAGTWEVDYVKEYDHFAEEARNVRD